MSATSSNLLELQGLSKRYGAATVVDQCSLGFQPGKVHALLGANGAGKSTLVRMIAGLVAPSSGSMLLDDRAYQPASKRDAESVGVEIVQQELNLINTLTVAENLLLTSLPNTAGILSTKRLHDRARDALDRFGLTHISTQSKVASLGVGQQQMIEICAALMRQCRLLILDEPTAALSPAESESLFQWLDHLRDDGVGIIYISHRLDEVARIADQISVLRDGQLVGTFDPGDCSTQRMVELMSGESAATHAKHTSYCRRDDVIFRVDGLRGDARSSGCQVHDVSFDLHRGEKLGIAGLVGSGRTELLRLIFGADAASAGGVSFQGDDSPRRFRHPNQAVSAGLAMVTEDRKQNGLLLSKPIRFNTTIASMWQRFSAFGIARQNAESKTTREQCDSLEVRCENIEQSIGTLSGGNQQKVAIAKWLVRDAQVFLMDEPTRGIDVAARRRIYQLIDGLAEQGKGILLVSSDLDELLEVCDRIAVMSDGRIVETFTRDNWSQKRMMEAAFSGYLDRRPA